MDHRSLVTSCGGGLITIEGVHCLQWDKFRGSNTCSTHKTKVRNAEGSVAHHRKRRNRGLASTKAITAAQLAASFGPRESSILVCHLPKSAKQMPIVEFADLEIGSAAERYRASMAKYLPKPLRTLYRGGRARAVNRFTSSNAATIIEIKRQCHEKSDFGHTFALCKFPSCALREASP